MPNKQASTNSLIETLEGLEHSIATGAWSPPMDVVKRLRTLKPDLTKRTNAHSKISRESQKRGTAAAAKRRRK